MRLPRFVRVVLIYIIIYVVEGMIIVLLLSRSTRTEDPITVALFWPQFLLGLSLLGGPGALRGTGLVLLVVALANLGLSLFFDLLLSCLQKPRGPGSSG